MKRFVIIFGLFLLVPTIFAQVDSNTVDEDDPPPYYASADTFALISVARANLRTEPNLQSEVVDIAMWGERYPIVGIFFPGESTVLDPLTEDEFVFDDIGEEEVWYLLEMGGGAAWIFGGLVLISQPEGLPVVGEDELTPEQQALLAEQLASFDGTLGVTATSRLRAGAGTDFAQVGIVPFGGRVVVIGRNQFSTWFYVNHNGTLGWISVFLLATPDGWNAQGVPIVQ